MRVLGVMRPPLLLLVVALAGLQPASSAVFFFSRDEVPTSPTTAPTTAPPPAPPATAPCVCSLADWCQPVFDPKEQLSEVGCCCCCC